MLLKSRIFIKFCFLLISFFFSSVWLCVFHNGQTINCNNANNWGIVLSNSHGSRFLRYYVMLRIIKKLSILNQSCRNFCSIIYFIYSCLFICSLTFSLLQNQLPTLATTNSFRFLLYLFFIRVLPLNFFFLIHWNLHSFILEVLDWWHMNLTFIRNAHTSYTTALLSFPFLTMYPPKSSILTTPIHHKNFAKL